MNARFLNVGQGDSIIIEWGDPDNISIGIVDCCSYKESNPVINYLSTLPKFRLEFIILSHPHKDHYSGLLDLFYYIRDNGIKLKTFIHTLAVHPSYLRWTELDSQDAISFEKVLDMLLSLKDDYKLIDTIQYALENWQYQLDGNLVLKSFSPSDEEIRAFTAKIDYYSKEHWHICSSAANYLSTILVIEDVGTKRKMLLTSDAIDFSFKRLKGLNFEFNCFQIPHHGSINSLFEQFWKQNIINEPKVAVISAGLHKRYNLPDYDVVKFFHELGVDIKSTNYVNGMKEYFDSWNRRVHIKTKALDDVSEQIFDSFQSNDDGILLTM